MGVPVVVNGETLNDSNMCTESISEAMITMFTTNT